MAVVNHIGLCVSDLERSRRFYEALGFVGWYDADPPDRFLTALLRLAAPIGLRCAYLRNGEVVLELLAYDDCPTLPQERAMNNLGLTHLSLSVPDVAAAKARVGTLGGEVLADTDVGAAVMVRDPDGQLLELLPMAYRDSLPPRDG